MTVKFSRNIPRLIKYLFLVQALWNLKQINHSETTQLSFSFLKKFLNIPSSSLVLHLNVASRILELVINNHILYSLHPIYVTFTFFMFFILFSRSLKWVTRWLFFFLFDLYNVNLEIKLVSKGFHLLAKQQQQQQQKTNISWKI